MTKITATSGIKLFEIIAADGRRVCLDELWYHVHILQRKPEIRDLANPLQEIERALTHAVSIGSTSYSHRPIYIGPALGKGFWANECLHVTVEPKEDNRGFVVTVVMRKAVEK